MRQIRRGCGPRGAVEPEVGIAVGREELFQDVEDTRHLREDETAVALGAQAAQQNREGLQLAAVILDEASLGEEQGGSAIDGAPEVPEAAGHTRARALGGGEGAREGRLTGRQTGARVRPQRVCHVQLDGRCDDRRLYEGEYGEHIGQLGAAPVGQLDQVKDGVAQAETGGGTGKATRACRC